MLDGRGTDGGEGDVQLFRGDVQPLRKRENVPGR